MGRSPRSNGDANENLVFWKNRDGMRDRGCGGGWHSEFLFVPYPYRSTAVLRSEGDRSPDDWSALSREAFTAQALSDIIRQEHLYADAPAEDVMDRMRRGIRVRPAAPNLVQVSFGYDDPIRAQRVSQDLVSRIVAANLSPAVNPNRQVIELVEPADQARRQIEAKARTAFTALGLAAGLLFGVLLALILRRRTPAIR